MAKPDNAGEKGGGKGRTAERGTGEPGQGKGKGQENGKGQGLNNPNIPAEEEVATEDEVEFPRFSGHRGYAVVAG